MVALVVGLKLRLLRNGLRRSTWRIVAMIIGAVYAAGLVVLAWAGMSALRFAGVEITGSVTVIGFGMVTLVWLLMSLLMFGSDETVDPARFALLPVPATKLQPGLLLAGLLGIPGVATALAALSLVVTWSRGPATVIATIVVIPLGVATCFLLARTGTSAFSQALSSRRFRDVAAIVLALFGATVGVSINAIMAGIQAASLESLTGLLNRVAAVVGWTPVGWVWSVPAELASGDPLRAILKYLLALAFAAGLWRAWRHFLAESLTSPLESGGGGKQVAGHNRIDRLFPDTPAGAVAGRALRYYRRDPRYLAALASVAMLPLIIVVVQVVNGQRSALVFAPVLLALMIGSMVTNDISYDGSAFWLHVTSGISGTADRTGRVLATATVVAPVLVGLTVVLELFTGRVDVLPHVAAILVAFTLSGLGIGCWAGAVWQIPVPPPGANPFQRGNSGGMAAMASFLATIGLTILCGLPTIVLTVASIWFGWMVYLALAVAVATGLVVLRIGIRAGGARLDRHWPEIFARVSAKS